MATQDDNTSGLYDALGNDVATAVMTADGVKEFDLDDAPAEGDSIVYRDGKFGFEPITGGGGGDAFAVDPVIKTSSFSAAVGIEYRISASTGGDKTVTLPVGPPNQSRIRLVGVGGGSDLVTINTSGATVDYAFTSTSLGYTFQVQGFFLELEFTAAGGRWHVRGDQPQQWFGDVGALLADSVLTTDNSGYPAAVQLADNEVLGRTTGNLAGLAISSLGTATRRYLDVAAATVAALPANTWSGSPLFQLTATSNGALTVDGESVSAGQLVLVNSESDSARSGVYTVLSAGGVSSTWQLIRTYLNNSTNNSDNIFRVAGGNVYKGWKFKYDADVSRFVSLQRPSVWSANVGADQDITPGKSYPVVSTGVTLTVVVPPYATDVLDTPRFTVKNQASDGTLVETTGADTIEDPELGTVSSSVAVVGQGAAVTWVGRAGEFGMTWYVESRQMTGTIYPPAATYQVSTNTDMIPDSRYLVDTTGGIVTMTLPDPALSSIGEVVVKRYLGGANVVIEGFAGETIDGALTLTLTVAGEWATLVSDGTNWAQVG